MQDISYPYETWTLCKPKVTSSKGVVVAQEIEAASIGARMIESGGNAIDGAIATAFALSVTEPWMSGPGGGGFMMFYVERTKQQSTEGMVSELGNYKIMNFNIDHYGSRVLLNVES